MNSLGHITQLSFFLTFLALSLALLTNSIPLMSLFFGLFGLTLALMFSLRASNRTRNWRQRTIQVLPAARSAEPVAQDGFALLDDRFQAVVQVRARHFQEGTIALPEWEGRYQALLQARQELEASTFREAALRLDEYRAAVTSRRLQQSYERKLKTLCDETMEAILQRADTLMSQMRAPESGGDVI